MCKRMVWIGVLGLISVAHGQSVPETEWTSEERAWVDNARKLYAEQGIEFTQDQANEAIGKSRRKNDLTVGVPESEWTADERRFVEQIRADYKKRGAALAPEQERLAVQQMRERMARMLGNVGAIQAMRPGMIRGASGAISSQPLADESSTLEEEMQQKLSMARSGRQPIAVLQRRDGFDVNGRRYVDSAGRVSMVASDVLTGDIAYVVERNGNYSVKLLPGGDIQRDPIEIANVSREGKDWLVKTRTGKNLAGNDFSVTPNGVFVSRDAAAFLYEAGIGVRNIPAPEGFRIAPLQRGNVGTTGYVLLERVQQDNKKGLAGLGSALKGLGSVVGMGQIQDYALMNTSTGDVIPLGVESSGKNVSQLSDCRRKNDLINVCSRSTSFESLYDQNGRNDLHYYWRIVWYQTPKGPIAISLENGVKDVFVTDLTSKRRVLAFNRALGINSVTTEQLADGRVTIDLKYAFQTKEIPDALALLDGDVAAQIE